MKNDTYGFKAVMILVAIWVFLMIWSSAAGFQGYPEPVQEQPVFGGWQGNY
jgi:hypothetical protein